MFAFSENGSEWIAQVYLPLWRIEEIFRFGKKRYQLEDFRVLRYQRLKKPVLLTIAVAHFAAAFWRQN
jgi:hypothetical protein